MHRRGFIAKVIKGTALLFTSTLPYTFVRLMTPNEVEAKPQQRISLPGALEDPQAFIDACIACGLCGEVCPPKCVKFYSREGSKLHNTPYINPEIKACTLCGICMEICPTNALSETPIREIKMGVAQIDRTACYPWVDTGVCGACMNICPLGESAIRFDFANMYRPVVQKACVGCGLCVEICPHPSLPIRIVDYSFGTVMHHKTG